ncbi:MAG TPA: hypothetical protein DEB24_05770 [Coriobacteriia bacterium]|nr:hypothetical protein [Coriobacteriia bacterium]
MGTDPQMTGATLGTAIAQSFIEYYKINGLDMANLTLSVIDMTKIADLVSSFEAFVGTVDLSKVSFQEVAKDRSNTKEFGFSSAYEHHFDVVDIGDLAAQFSEKSAQESANLTAALSAAVVYSEKGQHDDIASGLSVYFPYNGPQYLNANMAAYKTLGFSSTYVNYIDSFVSTLTSTPLAQLESISQTPTTDESASAGRGLYRTAIAPEQTANIESVYATVWQEMPNGTYRQVYRDDTVQLDATTGEMLAEFDGRVTTVDGHIACMYELVRGDGFVRYNVPGFINREFVNLQIVFDETSPGGRVLGATPVINASQVAARQMLPIEEGSDLAMCYDALTPENYAEFETATIEDVGDYSSSGTSWTVGEYSTTGKTVTMATTDLPKGNYLFGFMVKDLQGNTYATKPIPFSRS